MLPVQRRLIALFLVHLALIHGRGLRLRNRRGLPASKTDPRTLLLPCVHHVEKPKPRTVLLQDVFHAGVYRQRLRPRQINSTILQLLPIEHSDGNKAAGLRLAQVARPLQHGNRAQLRCIFVLLRDLAGVLREGANGKDQRNGNRYNSRDPRKNVSVQ